MNRKKIFLGVNIDHFATLRQARYKDNPNADIAEPNLAELALLCQKSGADCITMHLREDARHVQAFDVRDVKDTINIRLNLEMACTLEMLKFAKSIKPDSVCLVPEKREEVTTEGGLDLEKHFKKVENIINELSNLDISTSLFIDPSESQIKLANKLKAPIIELHTGKFSNAYAENGHWDSLEELRVNAELAHDLNLIVNAGHGINYNNVKEVINIPFLNELNIGHSIVSKSSYTGIELAVKEMISLINQ